MQTTRIHEDRRWPCFPPPRKVAVLRALQLGDLLCAVPALRALRAAWPEAEIVLIGLPWARILVERYPKYFDRLLEFPGYPGMPERPICYEQLPAFFENAQREQFDLAIQMHGSGAISNPLTVALHARRTAGFYLPGQYCPDAELFLPYPEHEHEVWRLLRLMDFLGIPPRGDHLEFPLHPADEEAAREVAGVAELEPGGYVILHAGARAENRRWPAEYFAAVGDALAERNYRIVLTGSADEAGLTRRVAQAMRSPCLDLAGQTPLNVLALLLAKSRLLVCNDTGVSHLAAAVRAPSVVILTRSDKSPESWPPLDRVRHRVVCRLTGATPADVLAEVDDVFRNAECRMQNAEPSNHSAFCILHSALPKEAAPCAS